MCNDGWRNVWLLCWTYLPLPLRRNSIFLFLYLHDNILFQLYLMLVNWCEENFSWIGKALENSTTRLRLMENYLEEVKVSRHDTIFYCGFYDMEQCNWSITTELIWMQEGLSLVTRNPEAWSLWWNLILEAQIMNV